jgi:diacylglycerol kinase family enzyme
MVTPARTLVVVNPNAQHGVTGELVPAIEALIGDAFPYEMVATEAAGARHRFDVGVCNDLYFANSISMGFDAKVTAKAVEMKHTTRRSGLALYLSAMLDVMLHDFASHRVRISLDNGPEQDADALLMAVCIGPTYGGGFKIVPLAVADDGLLDLLVIDSLPQHGALWRFPFVVVGRHAWMRQAHFSRHTTLRVSSGTPLPGQIDGEVMLSDTYDIRILPAAIEVIVPPEPAG